VNKASKKESTEMQSKGLALGLAALEKDKTQSELSRVLSNDQYTVFSDNGNERKDISAKARKISEIDPNLDMSKDVFELSSEKRSKMRKSTKNNRSKRRLMVNGYSKRGFISRLDLTSAGLT